MIRARPKIERSPATPIYNIGAVSRLTGLAVWAVRWIERHKLVTPKRTGGNQRLFSDLDVERLHEIRELMEEGVNVAGVRVILRMRVERTIVRVVPSKNGARRIKSSEAGR